MAASVNIRMPRENADRVNVLLVDDQPARLLSYRAILEPLGEHLVEAQSGTEALGRLMETEFALILLDVNMPGMDGFETASMIHEHPRFEKTPIIFVTAVNVTEMDRLRGYDLGAVDYVTVPVIPEILRSKVMVLAELFRKRRELQKLNASLAAANDELRIEKNREVHKLNETLRDANTGLASINASLQAEIAERSYAEERLREADRRKDEFLATLAHELRNPLAPIQSALNVFLVSPDVGAAREDLIGIMQRQMQQMVRLIDDLLDVSRITRGALTLQKQRTDLGSVLEAALETARPLIEEAAHRLHTEIPVGELPITADPQRLAQVFANLLNNACKYTEPGGEIWLTVRQENDEFVVSVRDNGIGLSTAQITHIFDMFVQVDSSLERARGGLGIGLTLVRHLVELHGGRIRVRSDGLGHGSEFLAYLPLSEGEVADARPCVAGVVGEATQPLRIMVVDDNHDGADTLTMLLGILGHQVRTLYDPLEVVEAAAGFLPELAFLDVGMPNLNGYELASLLRRQPYGAHLLLVALTGWGQENDRRRSAEAGFDEHLVKPIDLETIERICGWAQTREPGANAPSVPVSGVQP